MKLVENDEQPFIMGGATIYKLFIDKIETLYLTRILSDFQADVYFPELNMEEWDLVEDEFVPKDEINIYDLRFQTYKRKQK